MKRVQIDTSVIYTFKVSARQLTHIRHALNIATQNTTGKKSASFAELHDDISKQVNGTLEAFKEHFEAMLTMTVAIPVEDGPEDEDQVNGRS